MSAEGGSSERSARTEARAPASAQGCMSMCPLYGAKCTGEANHSGDHEAKHVFPAMNGLRQVKVCDGGSHLEDKGMDFEAHCNVTTHMVVKNKHGKHVSQPLREWLDADPERARWQIAQGVQRGDGDLNALRVTAKNLFYYPSSTAPNICNPDIAPPAVVTKFTCSFVQPNSIYDALEVCGQGCFLLPKLRLAIDDLEKRFATVEDALEVVFQFCKRRLAERADGGTEANRGLALCGPPGTGKTTLARELAPIFKQVGVTHNDKIIIKSKEDLIGQYIGHTEANMNVAVQEAKGGIIYLNEAHQLVPDGRSNDFGCKVIEKIVSHTGETPLQPQDEVMFIISDYKDRLDSTFFMADMGLRRRFTMVPLRACSVDELIEIFALECGVRGITCDLQMERGTLYEVFSAVPQPEREIRNATLAERLWTKIGAGRDREVKNVALQQLRSDWWG